MQVIDILRFYVFIKYILLFYNISGLRVGKAEGKHDRRTVLFLF